MGPLSPCDRSIRQRIAHKLTAYHWRHNRRGVTVIGHCSCGHTAWFMARRDWERRWRMLRKLCWLRGHALGDFEDVHVGPVDFEESEDTLWYSYRQCGRCYTCVEAKR